LISVDKDFVDLRKPVLVEAKIEAWLKMLLEAMRDSLKYIFHKFYNDVVLV